MTLQELGPFLFFLAALVPPTVIAYMVGVVVGVNRERRRRVSSRLAAIGDAAGGAH